MSNFSVAFDPGSLAEIARLRGFAALLNPEVTSALAESGQIVTDAAKANTWTAFMNPTGTLADSIIFWVVSPTEVEIQVGVPYGHRREYSFKGPDSLGRMFPNDPAEPYAQPAVDATTGQVQALMATAVYNAWGKVAG